MPKVQFSSRLLGNEYNCCVQIKEGHSGPALDLERLLSKDFIPDLTDFLD